MPNYGLPGVTMGRRSSQVLGGAALAAIVAVALAWTGYHNAPDDTRMQIQLRTERIGEGIIEGTTVRLDGVDVGKITDIASIGAGRQLITLDLDRSPTAGLTEDLAVDYAPQNLFGISTVALKRAEGGAPLRPGAVIDLAGANAHRVADATMGRLLRALTETSTEVFTPEFAEVLRTFSGDLQAFTPMLEAVVMLSRAVADTQRYPSSFLIDQFARFYDGLGSFTSATFKLLKAVLDIEVFQNDRQKFDATIGMLVDDAFPDIGAIGNVARQHFSSYTDMLAPLIAAIAATVPHPARSHAELTELIERLDRIFADTPNGPTLNASVTLRSVPGLSVPLLGQAGFAAPGGTR
ncbi:MlaD family protein [Nocardia sp. NBC_01009]|uniref:MlaD family protein n=1 Tax=Nocardia sp. NBC_01009 TaxID=2975996 RepID=UPI00386BFEA2|nr:MlaD family protein [Nocardia sp. NBC_01009]